MVIAAAGAAVYMLVKAQLHSDHRRATVQAFVTDWTKGDHDAMYALLDAASRRATTKLSFDAEYRRANAAAGVTSIQAGSLTALHSDGTVSVPATVKTERFGTLTGTLTFRAHEEAGKTLIAWSPELRLPGLRKGEAVRRRSGVLPKRGSIYDSGGRILASDPTGAAIAGEPPTGRTKATGLERIYDARLAGAPSSTLRFGDRVIARVDGKRPKSVHTTIRLGLQRTANAALGGKLGGVAVLNPRSGAILALAGLAVSAPQPPGSTFKIITLAAALKYGIATPASSYPVRTAATLSGVTLSNAGGESCGGGLSTSFADSCNSVFAPLGARLGAKRLVATAELFGFNEQPDVPAAKADTIPKASELKDAIAVGSSAIGQDKDLATPLGMASVAATIGNGGVRVKPHLAGTQRRRKRAVSAKVAGEVRDMMLAVVNSGTGKAGAVPGVAVAGKTGTAELRPNSTNPKDADAWFVAFAPAGNPRVAVAVMLVGAGFGGTAAAPIARQVMRAAL